MNKLITSKRHLATSHDADVVKIKTERNSLGVLKTLIVVLLIAVQLFALIWSAIYISSLFKFIAILSMIFTIFTCIYVLSSDKNSQSKPIWIFFLLTCFTFGYIVYFISSENVFWRKYKKPYANILNKSYKNLQYNSQSINNDKIQSEVQYLENAGNFIAYNNTLAQYFKSGASMFDDVLDNLKKAKNFIFLEFFIVSDGVLLTRMLDILQEKVKNGVDVRLIYDDFGSHGSFSRKMKKKIKMAGIKLYAFNKMLPKFNVLLNYRDHRKIIVIDGKVAYTGGTNLADEYINEKRSHGYWKDAGIKLEGEAVDGLTLMFLRQYQFVSKQDVDYLKYTNLHERIESDSVFVPYADGLEYKQNIAKNAYTNMIANANEKIYIMSPYFVVDDTITNLLINKANSGVDVRIILPEIADKKIVYIISRNNAEKLMRHGVKLFVMKNSFVHSKVVLTEHSAVVGSINMDLRSFYQQFEDAVYTNDKKVLKDIQQDFEDTFKKSELICKANLKRNKISFRIVAGIVNLISPFM